MIESILERIAVALERQAAAMEKNGERLNQMAAALPAPVTTGSPAVVETVVVSMKPVAEKPAEKSVEDDKERNALKVELHKRGITFSERARTATLRELLVAATTPAPTGAPVEAKTVITPKAEVTPTASVTPRIEEVRAALISVKDNKGDVLARDIMVKFGKAEKLSAVAPENYAAVVAACGEALTSELAQ